MILHLVYSKEEYDESDMWDCFARTGETTYFSYGVRLSNVFKTIAGH